MGGQAIGGDQTDLSEVGAKATTRVQTWQRRAPENDTWWKREHDAPTVNVRPTSERRAARSKVQHFVDVGIPNACQAVGVLQTLQVEGWWEERSPNTI